MASVQEIVDNLLPGELIRLNNYPFFSAESFGSYLLSQGLTEVDETEISYWNQRTTAVRPFLVDNSVRFNPAVIKMSSKAEIRNSSVSLPTRFLDEDSGLFYVLDEDDDATPDDGFTIVSADLKRFKPKVDYVTPEMFGAVGDGVANDLAAFVNMLSYSPGKIQLAKGKTYRINGGIALENVTLDMNNATLDFYTVGATTGLRLKSNSVIINGTVSNTVTSPAGSGEFGCGIILGEYQTTAEVKNVKLDGLTLSTNRPNGTGIFCMGNTHDVEITNLIFPASSTLGRAIGTHWGNRNDPQEDFQTTHPYNIKIANIEVGAMTYAGAPTESAPVTISGSKGVVVDGVKCAQAQNGVVVFAGDFGFDFASAADKASAYKGIEVRNVIVDQVDRYGLDIVGNATLGSGRQIMPVVVDNCSLNTYSRGTRRGVNILNIIGPKVTNCKISGFFYGIIDAGLSGNVTIENNYITNCDWPYHMSGFSSSYSFGWVVSNNKSIGNTSASSRASFYVEYSKNIILENNYVQDSLTWGFRLADGCKVATLKNNHVEGVKTEGKAYSNGSVANYLTLANFHGNTYEAGITPTDGMSPIIVETRPNGTRRLRGTAAPASGAWLVGDFVENTAQAELGAASSKYIITGWICTVAGSPGTWLGQRSLTGN